MELDPDLWRACDEEEWHRLLENTLRPVHHHQVPKSEKIAYYNKQVKEKLKVIDGQEFIEARVRGTLGGNVLDYKGPTSTNTADYTLVKILWSAVLHDIKHVDPETFFVNLDMVDFYLGAPMEIVSYMMVPLKDIPAAIVEAYGLSKWAIHGKVHFKILMSLYGHPAAGYLANRLLVKTILPDGYYEDPNIPCLFKHETRSTMASLVVDDFGVKANSIEDVMHLVNSISKVWKVKINWKGDKFLGMDLAWNRNPENPSLLVTNNSAIPDALKRFYPNETLKGASTPMQKQFTKRLLAGEVPKDEPEPSPRPDMKQRIQEFAGTHSHLGRTVRYDIVPAVNEIAETQASPTDNTVKQMDHLANYMARHPEGGLEYKATDMVLRAHYDSSLKPHARHKAGGILYLSDKDAPPEEIGNITEVISKTPQNGVASIAEGEYCAQFLTGQTAIHHRHMLEAMNYPQPPTRLYGDNTTAIGIATDTVKVKKSKAFDKSYHWTRDQARQGILKPIHIDTKLNSSDYMTKAHGTSEHKRQVVKITKFPTNQQGTTC
jgi:hypothetical protein